jgi:O-antigen/teichoic acid export membrane protein
MKLAIGLAALTLFSFSFFETIISFVRSLILTHTLGSYEFGFASAIAVTSATFGQITDIAIYRFVYSSPRSVYAEAIAAAHAIALVRGFFVGGCVLLASLPVACSFATCTDWPSFALVAPIPIIQSFDHLEINVAERDYRYLPQLIASVASHSCGLVALIFIAFEFENHYAIIAYMLVQALVYMLASHLLASHPYRVTYRTPFVRKGLDFSLPLVLNGIGLAVMSQGDRWIVGTLLGLPFLGLYSVALLAALVPMVGLVKILGPVLFAGLHNANVETNEYHGRLQLFSSAIPTVAGAYALSLIGLLGILVPAVFGRGYAISELAVVLLALIAFFRLARVEPHTALLLHTQNTRKLAIANQAPVVGLLVTAILAIVHPTLESVLVGVLFGEAAGFCAMALITRRLLSAVFFDYAISVAAILTLVIAAGFLTLSIQDHGVLATRSTIVGGFLIIIVGYAGVKCLGLYQKAYGKHS